jgi:hypothetical protein
LLTDRIPNADFDDHGICALCREGYPNYRPIGIDAFAAALDAIGRGQGDVDCVVGVSGGKDSTFALWAMKEHFGRRVHAFTYDHDGVHEQARRNVREACRALDVPLTVVSLPPKVHSRTFARYFRAWLQHPDVVTAGLTCVACKHLHFFGTDLAAKLNAPLVVWATCPLEVPPFVALSNHKDVGKRASPVHGAMLLGKTVLSTPHLAGAILSSLATTTKGCLLITPETSPYLRFRYPSVHHLSLFEYWPWNPTEIYRTLEERTGWRAPSKAQEDWHFDCNYHVLKEYMFQSLYGIGYIDGYYSNLIRANLMTRDEALQKVEGIRLALAAELEESLKKADLGDLKHCVDPSCFAQPA